MKSFLAAIGDKVWRGIKDSEGQMALEAKQNGRDIESHRSELQARYHRLYDSLKLTGSARREYQDPLIVTRAVTSPF